MAICEVVMLGNPILRKVSCRITDYTHETLNLQRDLKDTLSHLQKEKEIGRAIAAPQIGKNLAMIYADLGHRQITMINPKIIKCSDETFNVWDSCFSFDVSFFIKINRYKSITVTYEDMSGTEITEDFYHELAELFQHEIDHLNGILATDYLEDNKRIIMREEWEKIRCN